jgi:hypothetical protein
MVQEGTLRQVQRRLLRFLTVLCFQLIFCASTFAAQQAGLQIIVLTGNGEENVINEIPPQPFSVRVVDAANRPVTGANVMFTAPSTGPSGSFPTGLTFNTITDEEGRALGLLYRPNSVEGSYTIQVRVEYQGQSAMATVRQSNVLVQKSSKMSSKRKFVFIALAGAGAAIAASGLSGGGGSGNSGTPPRPPTPTITFGGSSIGGQ